MSEATPQEPEFDALLNHMAERLASFLGLPEKRIPDPRQEFE